MIDSISHIAAQQVYQQNIQQHSKLKELTPMANGIEGAAAITGATAPKKGEFDNIVGQLVKEVDAKSKAAVNESNRVMLGQTDNIHQSMVAMQEASLAFNLMVEVRNKLVNSYQELMKMPV